MLAAVGEHSNETFLGFSRSRLRCAQPSAAPMRAVRSAPSRSATGAAPLPTIRPAPSPTLRGGGDVSGTGIYFVVSVGDDLSWRLGFAHQNWKLNPVKPSRLR